MSMSGQRRLELERQRMEELRLTQVRGECQALADACHAELGRVRDVAVQQLAAPELQRVAADLAAVRGRISAAPDAALQQLGQLQCALHHAIASGQARARAWSKEQAAIVAEARAAAQQSTAVAGDTGPALRARDLAEAGDLAAAREALAAAASAATEARAANLAEQARREAVRGIFQSLHELGFVSAGPRLADGVVVLEGRLASGRRAVFEVHQGGLLHFDLDGYEGRACADDLARVDAILHDRYGVRLGPPQFEWKNPDRLSRTAQAVPTGATHKKT